MAIPIVTDLSEMYRAADGGAIATMLAKLGVEKSLTAKLEDTRQALQVRPGTADIGADQPVQGLGKP